METLQEKHSALFKKIPTEDPAEITFMEIAGYTHYENICSNILKFFLTPNQNLGSLNGMLLNAFFKLLKREDLIKDDYTGIIVRREFPTGKGRIDLVIISSRWVCAIENKIRHELNNDLVEYAEFLTTKFPDKELIPVVLSLKNEERKVTGGFKNIMYDQLINEIKSKQIGEEKNLPSSYKLIFDHFIQTLKRLNMPIEMTPNEISFLEDYDPEINEIISLKNKLASYINARAHKIREAIKSPGIEEPWVWGGYDVGFHFAAGETRYKVECPIDLYNKISIVICVEPNTVDIKELEKLQLFQSGNPKYIMKPNDENNRMVIMENINFSIPDEELIAELKEIISLMKIAVPTTSNQSA